MRHLSENELRQFYVAYRAMEETAYALKKEAESFYRQAIKRAVQRDLLLSLVFMVLFGVWLYATVP